MKLLLLSNSKLKNMSYLEYAIPTMKEFLPEKKKLLFIPYAGVSVSFDDYEKKILPAFNEVGQEIKSIHHFSDPVKAVEESEGIVIGGGSTWMLLHLMQKNGLIDPIRKKVMEGGAPYIGWSAGSNVAAPTIKTTNDMPITEPSSFNALNFVPFQINAHYPLRELENHFGETRAERLNEFIIANPNTTVAAMEEGMIFHVENNTLTLKGEERQCHIFKKGQEIKVMKKSDDFSFLLNS